MKKFEDYKNAVLLAYQKKKTEGTLPANLDRHTVANLKNECVDEFPTRYSKKDAETFKLLFGPANSSEEYFQKVKASDPNIFKPLNSFLKGNIGKTSERNIHLLAWLIDFEPRPFKPVDPYLLGHNDNGTPEPVPESDNPNSPDADTTTEDQEPDIDKPTKTDDDNTTGLPPIDVLINGTGNKHWLFLSKFIRTRKTDLIVLFTICVILILYWMLKPKTMYWDGNEYQSIAFYQDVDSPVLIVPLDAARLDHLKKIKNLKTIKRSDIGIVHYSKIDTIVEFYNTGGKNPEDTTRWLHPMTKYMYEKYILNKAINN